MGIFERLPEGINQALSSLSDNVLFGLIQTKEVVMDKDTTVLGIDMSIDSLRSIGYSYYIFGFLILSLILFCYIIYLYMPKGEKKLKTGERIMFGAIVLGVIAAVIMGYVQLIEGYLI